MKKLTTVNAALAAVRQGFYSRTAASWAPMEPEVIFSAVFPRSGHVYYTCRIFDIVYSGFLHPEDKFDVRKVKPKARCEGDFLGSSLMSKNWVECSSTEEHEAYHRQEVQRLLDKSILYCPGRLARFRE